MPNTQDTCAPACDSSKQGYYKNKPEFVVVAFQRLQQINMATFNVLALLIRGLKAMPSDHDSHAANRKPIVTDYVIRSSQSKRQRFSTFLLQSNLP